MESEIQPERGFFCVESVERMIMGGWAHRMEAGDGGEVALVAHVPGQAGGIRGSLGSEEVRRAAEHVREVEPVLVAGHVLGANQGGGGGPRAPAAVQSVRRRRQRNRQEDRGRGGGNQQSAV